MKPTMKPRAPLCQHAAVAIAALTLVSTSANAGVIFSESFESPVVSGFASNTVPDTGWVGASNGYGATNRGLYNETVAWPATPAFSTPYGEQGYMINYTNSGLTTAQGTLSETLTQDVTYTLSFNVAVQAGTASGSYIMELVAFSPSDDDTARKEAKSTRPGTILATANGTVTTTDMSQSDSIVFTAAAGNPSLDKELGIRLIKGSNSVIYDNIRLIRGHDLQPSPADGVTIAGGNVLLSWTNIPPNTNPDVYVDVWFGTDPVSDFTRVVTGGANTTSVTVNAPTADTYYWRVDSYLDGSATGVPVQDAVFVFHITDTDADGLPDSYELAHTNPPSNIDLDPAADLENAGAGDGLTNMQEYQYGTDPNNPDSDGDHLEDGAEIAGTAGLRPPTDPLNADSDGDGLPDDVETNTGTWVAASDTGTNPIDADYDDDGLKDGVETKTNVFVSAANTGTDPYLADSDADGAWDWYEIAATFTDPNSAAETPDVPYPLPNPDGTTGAADKPVKVYIMAGQSNMVGIGYTYGINPGSMETILMRDKKFPHMVEGSSYSTRNDVYYRGVISAIGDGPLQVGITGNRVGPEHGFGHIMGWYHEEPVLLIKASQGNRSIGWDFYPPGSPQYVVGDMTYAGYGETPNKWLTTDTNPTPVTWYAGKQYDECFLDESDWAPAGAGFDAVTNAADVLANFDTLYPDWAAQGYEIAGFVWWQGHKDHTDGVYAPRYEQNLVNLIHSLRTDFNAPNAPFVVASIGFGGGAVGDKPANYQLVHNGQMAVGDPAQYPGFAGTVKSVNTLPYWRTLAESPGKQDFHYNNNAETYTLVGDAMGRAMIDLLNGALPPADYTAWATDFPAADLSDPDADLSGNGLTNDEARIWGLDPLSGAAVHPISTPIGADGSFSYTRRHASLTGLSYEVWTSTDLVTWTKDALAGQSATPDTPVTNVEKVAVTLSAVPAGERFFIQLRAVE